MRRRPGLDPLRHVLRRQVYGPPELLQARQHHLRVGQQLPRRHEQDAPRLRPRHRPLRLRGPPRRHALREPGNGWGWPCGGRRLLRRPLPAPGRDAQPLQERDLPTTESVPWGPRVPPGQGLRRGRAAHAGGQPLQRRRPRHARRPLHRGPLRGGPRAAAAVQRARPLRGPAPKVWGPPAALEALLGRRPRLPGLPGPVRRGPRVSRPVPRLPDLQHLRHRPAGEPGPPPLGSALGGGDRARPADVFRGVL
mmetsp:Transcript_105432/g.328672  ORF Transcript_105432/g.328672 Transcript_105432/m.328672 type:complete len:251 (+) Transcript_105432:441-1193(+)